MVSIEEIGRHGLTKLTRDGTTARWTVVHIHTNTHMVNQLSHSLNLLNRRVGRDGIGHIFPVVGRFAEIDGQGTVFRMVFRIVSMASLSLQRMVPILHQLGSSCCHATCIAVSARTAFALRAEIVVGIVLVPCGLHEVNVFPTAMTRNKTAALLQHGPICGHGKRSRHLRGSFHYPSADDFQIICQSGSHIIGIESALIGIADNGTIVVVA